MTRSVGNLDIIATARNWHVPGWSERLNKDVSPGGGNFEEKEQKTLVS